MVFSNQATKYLGVIIDAKLSLWEHLDYSCQKTVGAATALVGMLPKHCRRLLAEVVRFNLHY